MTTNVSFDFLGCMTADMLSDPSGAVFPIALPELNWGMIGIADALNEFVQAGSLPCPEDFRPKAQGLDHRFVFEVEYRALVEECRAAADWLVEADPDADLSEVYCWVRVNFD